jgi:hypothetical protein
MSEGHARDEKDQDQYSAHGRFNLMGRVNSHVLSWFEMAELINFLLSLAGQLFRTLPSEVFVRRPEVQDLKRTFLPLRLWPALPACLRDELNQGLKSFFFELQGHTLHMNPIQTATAAVDMAEATQAGQLNQFMFHDNTSFFLVQDWSFWSVVLSSSLVSEPGAHCVQLSQQVPGFAFRVRIIFRIK